MFKHDTRPVGTLYCKIVVLGYLSANVISASLAETVYSAFHGI